MDPKKALRVSSVGRRGLVLMDGEGGELPARAAGRVFSTSPPVPGDLVRARRDGGTLLVEAVLPRQNTLTRADRGGDARVVAANVDLVMAVMSVAEPPFAAGLLDRILAAAEYDRLNAVVVLNKTDLYGEGDDESPDALLADYRTAGYRCRPVSCRSGEGVEETMALMLGRVVMMAGPSGAGKTSIARHLRPDLDLQVGGVSPRTARGRHTTTSSRLIPLGPDTFLMDTPGVAGYAIDHIPPEELGACFPEISALQDGCRFRDCYHDSEPGCAVREALESGRLSPRRYGSYLELLHAVRE